MLRTALLTSAAMLAFAGNSLLCRLALRGGSIDAASFGLVRLVAGAITLGIVLAARREKASAGRSRLAPAMLFAYVAAFSFAYTFVPAGTGALLLFGSVQATMLVAALRSGERFAWAEAAGFALALAGIVWLVLPGVESPPLGGSVLMIAAGIAWGVYSLAGRGSADPLADTARNFALAAPLAALVSVATIPRFHADGRGVALAVASGAVTSGLGYVAWFAALRRLDVIRAAAVQLSVPAIAAAGGVVFLAERLTLRLVLAAAVILGGVGLAVAGRARRARGTPT
jgi:drug/metabolite transporter (DMT)-like permease